jgi:dipeptidyl aminopeptidase/acylaminoacyl peptidase
MDLKARFTRNGDGLIYTRRPASGGPHEIAHIALGDLTIRTLSPSPESDDHSARPSPTRDEYAFVSNRSGDADVYLAHLTNDTIVNLTHSIDRNDHAPRWSPNGELLVMTTGDVDAGDLRLADREALSRARIRVIDREGRVTLDIPGLMPDWMPAW